MSEKRKTAVVALGGNAISNPDQRETIHTQFAQTRRSMSGILSVIQAGYDVVITHGNGPQVGYELIRVEAARGQAPEQPLGVLVASTEGWMGYMIEQSLMNRFKDDHIEKSVVSLVSQVLVSKDDPSLENPTKFVGSTYPEYEAYRLAEERGWTVKKDRGRGGLRRVVGSPEPLDILNADAIRFLLDSGYVVIAVGGGGVPTYKDENGHLEGVDAVIDKDRASAVLGNRIGADDLLILTAVEKVALNYGRADQVDLDRMTVSEAKDYHAIGHFQAGSMGPKVQAAIQFLEKGGKRVIITDLDHVAEAIAGKGGTTIVPD
ncbi:carbamate kinase [bacterium]|nr:carbamate kinase [bacterium]